VGTLYIFFGIIFSCFYQDQAQNNRIQITAFQSVEGFTESGDSGLVESEVPLVVNTGQPLRRGPLETLVGLPAILLAEEQETLRAALPPEADSLANEATILHHHLVHLKAITSLLDKMCAPLLASFEMRRCYNLQKIKEFESEKMALELTVDSQNG